jgi:ABC-type proline/glycine betaine transport system permease subunit
MEGKGEVMKSRLGRWSRARRHWLLLVSAAVLVTLAVGVPVAVAAQGETSTTKLQTFTTVTAVTSSEAPPSAEIVLPEGDVRVLGYIDKVWEADGKRYLSIDYIEMLDGEEAREAAVAAGVMEPDGILPNDYFIVNESSQLREFVVAASAPIQTKTFGGEVYDEAISWEQFMSSWSDSPAAGAEFLYLMPWWIERSGDEIVSISEQYVP